MHKSITRLSEKVDESSDSIDDGEVSLGGKGSRMVDGVCAQGARDGPVEKAVLQDVAGGHGVGRELVDKEGFVLALDKVQDDEAESEPLRLRHGAIGVAVEVGTGGDGGDVEKDGTNIFDDEDGSPGNL